MKSSLTSLSLLVITMITLLSGCASDYKIDQQTKEVTVVLPEQPIFNPQITSLKYSLRAQYRKLPVGIIQLGNQLKVSFPSDVLFGVGKVDLQANAKQYFDPLLNQLNQVQSNIAKTDQPLPTYHYMIEGLTDNSGNVKTNVKLSLQRAQHVADYLVDHGIYNNAIVAVKGYGGLYPVADNNTTAGRAYNRRIIITVQLANNSSSAEAKFD